MLFRLALALGKTVRELRETLSYREFVEWCQFYEIEPWGDHRADLRAGVIAATLQNVYYQAVGAEQTARPLDYMPYVDKPEPEKEPEIDIHELTDEQIAAWADAAIFGIAPGE
jgi:hypothetical protein